MGAFAHLLDRTIYPVQPLIIGIALFIWVLAFIIQIRSARASGVSGLRGMSPAFFICILLFLAIIAVEFAVGAIIKAAALNEIRPVLSGELESIAINGNPATRGSELFAALRAMRDTMGHHSHPIDSFDLSAKTSSGSVQLILRRDSGDFHEYWVFYPQFHATELNDVGHVFTDVLDRI
jgi:hypothetical protein